MLLKWYCRVTTGGSCLVLPTRPRPLMLMSCLNGSAASTSMPRLSAMKYSPVMVGLTSLSTSTFRVPPASQPLFDFGATWCTPAEMVQSPLDWAMAGAAASDRAAARLATIRGEVLRMGVISLLGGCGQSRPHAALTL
ncbi:hypothetical protein D3C80_1659450 [compost metagenome]